MRLPNNANASLALFLGRNILKVPYYKLETCFFGKLNGVSHEIKCIFNSSIQEFQAYLSLFFCCCCLYRSFSQTSLGN